MPKNPCAARVFDCFSLENALCKQTSYLLGDKSIRVNCINPGSNDTGYYFDEAHEAVVRMFPSERWGTPDDTADVLLFLHSAYAKWITGNKVI